MKIRILLFSVAEPNSSLFGSGSKYYQVSTFGSYTNLCSFFNLYHLLLFLFALLGGFAGGRLGLPLGRRLLLLLLAPLPH